MKLSVFKGWMTLMVIIIGFCGCVKHSIYDPDRNDDQSKGEYFDFSTSQEVNMNISYDVPEGYRVVFDVYDRYPMTEKNGRLVLNVDLQPIASGITNGYGKYDLEKVLPGAVKEFYVYTPSLFATTLLHGKIESSGVTVEEVDLSAPQAETVQTMSTRASDKWITLGGWNAKGLPDYYDPKKAVGVSAQTLYNIERNFPEGKKVSSVYFKKTDLYVAEKAEIWLTVIGSEGQHQNTLGYYCYTGKPEDIRKEELQKIVAVPRAKIDVFKYKEGRETKFRSVQLKYLNPATGKLESTFPEGVSIGWVLISNGYQSKWNYYPGTIDYSKEYFYSYAPWNPEKSNKEHMILFKTKNNGEDFVAFGFEDMNNGSGDRDCNDVMFHVTANPVDAITDEIPEVPDKEDEDIVKDEIFRGTLAFEDLWPRQGDYDLNDVVVKYKSTATTVVKSDEDYESYGSVTKVKDEFTLLWSGAVWRNAFGYQMDVESSNIKSLKVYRENEELASAWDKELGKVTIMLSEDILGDIGVSSGNVMNFTVEMEFADPIPVKEFNKEKAHAPYNPFIVSKGKNSYERVEVHLPMYAPTVKHNMEMLGTFDDRSDAGLNRYYVSEEMYPFALHIYGDNEFINKEETVRIDRVYPKYKNWVESNGREDTDWYKYPENK